MFPLKVLCIDGKARPYDIPGCPLPTENVVYTAAKEVAGWDLQDMSNIRLCYVIEELCTIQEFHGKRGMLVYETDRFVPLSDKDELEYADEVLEKIFEPVKIGHGEDNKIQKGLRPQTSKS